MSRRRYALPDQASSLADPLTNCSRENAADGRKAAGRAAWRLVPPTFERARGAILPCALGSQRNRQQRGERARGAAPPCALGLPQNRQRRGVASRFLRLLAHSGYNILGQAGVGAGLGREQFASRDGALVFFNVRDR